jgi:hypothetical protein
MSARARDAAAGRSPFRTAAGRAVAVAAGFLLITASLFAGVGAWQAGDAGAVAADDQQVDDGSTADVPAPDPTVQPAPDPEPEPAPEPKPQPEPEPEPVGPDPAGVTVQLLDAELDDGGAAIGRAADALEAEGFDVVAENRVAAARAGAYTVTTVLYTPGREAEGRLVAATLGATEVRAVTPENSLTDRVMVHVVVKGS